MGEVPWNEAASLLYVLFCVVVVDAKLMDQVIVPLHAYPTSKCFSVL